MSKFFFFLIVFDKDVFSLFLTVTGYWLGFSENVLQVMGDTQDKTDAYAALDQNEVDDYLQDILSEPEPITCDCQE